MDKDSIDTAVEIVLEMAGSDLLRKLRPLLLKIHQITSLAGKYWELFLGNQADWLRRLKLIKKQ